MATIAIVMSTYNGQTFLKEQINSILGQSFSDFTLYIRDDGSSDDTVSIIEEMASSDSRIIMVKDNGSASNKNVGFGASFSSAASFALKNDADFSYLAFCDQDDVWEADKLKAAMDKLSGVASDTPALYASNYYICDENLNINGIFSDTDPMVGVTFQNMFFEGVFPGFTLVINRHLAELSFLNDCSKDIYYHDKWVSLIALGLGGNIIFDTTPLAKYRRHSSAASSTNLGVIAKIKWRIDTVLNGDFCPRTKLMLKSFTQLFSDSVDSQIKHFLQIFTSDKKYKKLFYSKHLRRSATGEILLRIIILLGKL
ncbi:glycosyltransferase [Pseudobutyrivibrio ruminis]|uniref:glycosyltransferase n=1 Tax=Pseudobutyrivibrio ruminis TaxID=46206 RepID=UPI00040B85BB|nr:glycosyltransferase [Pseudobutyrivibrio ruminis]